MLVQNNLKKNDIKFIQNAAPRAFRPRQTALLATPLGLPSNQQNVKNQISRHYAEACNEWWGPSSRAYYLGNTVPKKRRSGGELWATLCRFNRPEIRSPRLINVSIFCTRLFSHHNYHPVHMSNVRALSPQ